MKRTLFLKFMILTLAACCAVSGLAGCSLSGGGQALLNKNAAVVNEPAVGTLAPPVSMVSTAVTAEDTAVYEKPLPQSDTVSEEKLVETISGYFASDDAINNMAAIKDCLSRLEKLPGVTGKNPFYWYVKGLVMQNESNMEAAADCMKKASAIAPNNRDISLWESIFMGRDEAKNGGILLDAGAFGFEGAGFSFFNGTQWVDDHRLLATIEEKAGDGYLQSLVIVDVDTVQYRTVYKGNYTILGPVTPDGSYALLYDKDLKLVSLDSGESKTVAEKAGYYASLSPDGKKIAYCSAGLWIYDIETGGKSKLDTGRDDACPIWYPDGKKLLFIGDLGGKDLGDGAGHLQGIFSIPSDLSGKKERIDETWQGKFRFLEWIQGGEVFHAEEGWDDGFNSVAYYLYSGFRKQLGSINDGQYLAYRQGKANFLYISDDRGTITLMDLEGRIRSRFEYGNIWGSNLGAPVMKLEALAENDDLLLYYRTPFEKVVHVCITDMELGNPVPVADLPLDSPLKSFTCTRASKAVFATGPDKLLIKDLKK